LCRAVLSRSEKDLVCEAARHARITPATPWSSLPEFKNEACCATTSLKRRAAFCAGVTNSNYSIEKAQSLAHVPVDTAEINMVSSRRF